MREELSPVEKQRLAEAQLYYDRIDHSLHEKTVIEQHLGFLLTLVAQSRATIQRQRETINQLRNSPEHPSVEDLDEEATCRWLSALGMEPQITTLTSTPGAGDDYKLTFQYLGPLFEPAEPVKAANHGPT